jgi:cell division transport system permease protein
MDIKTIYARAKRGVREDAKLYVVAVSSLTIAFLCLATALLGVANLAALAERWGRTHHMSVYLRDDASPSEVDRLAALLRSISGVERAVYTSAEQARERFVADTNEGEPLRALPKSAFPASLEVEFKTEARASTIDDVAANVALQRSIVEDVDTYANWFARLGALVSTGRAIALGLGLLVLLCVMAVVANTIRLAIASRREEIEVLKMCGATDSFVRAPFVIEGTLQGFVAALLSLGLLLAVYLLLRGQVDQTLTSFAGVQLVFLTPLMVLGLLAGGALVGALGSALSVRRYIAV